MPKQIFQRPAPVQHTKLPKGKNTPGAAPDWGRKTGKAVKPAKSGKAGK